MRDTLAVRDVALKNLLHHKGRTFLTIFTVALSVALMFIVLTYFHSDDQRLKRQAINEIGAYHVQYEHLSQDQLHMITGNLQIDKFYTSYNTRNIQSSSFRDMNMDMAIGYMEGINSGLIELRKGQAPTMDNEIVLDEWVIEQLGYAPKLGQQIVLNLEIMNDGKKTKMTQTFKLVGITEDIAVRKAARAGLMFVSKDFAQLHSPDADITIFALLKSDFNASSKATRIGEEAGLQDKQIKINEKYTQAYESDSASVLQSVFLVFVIVASSGIVIYNIFNIYISQQIRLFGSLKAIGMTPIQLRWLIHIEGLFISLIGSLSGILLGIVGSFAFIPFVGNTTDSKMVLYVTISPYIVGGAFILGLSLVGLSLHIPARRVATISEISAIRYNPTIIRSRRTTRNKLKDTLNIFTLVSAQLSRHQKRTWVTIASITITGLVFLITGSILNSMNMGNIARSMVPGDYKLSSESTLRRDQHSDPLNVDVIKRIEELNGIQAVHLEMYDELKYNKQDAAAHLSGLKEIMNRYIAADIYGYGDSLMQNAIDALGQGKVTLDEMKKGNYLIVIGDGDKTYHAGDKIRLSEYGESQEEYEFIIAGIIPSYITYKGSSSDGGGFIAHQSMFSRLELDQRVKQVSVTVGSKQQAEVEKALKELAGSDRKIEFSSFWEIYQEYNGMKRIMEATAYGFIAVLMIISMFNLINSNLTSMLSRKREISMIEALGLSRSQLTLQLASEGLIVVLISLILIFSLGIPAGYFGVGFFSREATYVNYRFPLWLIITLTCSYLTIQVATTIYMQRKLSKESLMERIRYNE